MPHPDFPGGEHLPLEVAHDGLLKTAMRKGQMRDN